MVFRRGQVRFFLLGTKNMTQFASFSFSTGINDMQL